MKDSNEYNVRAVERAIQILSSFETNNRERGISDIAKSVNLHKATTHRIVQTLLNHGYLERSHDKQKYRLGVRLANIGASVIRSLDLQEETIPYLTGLQKKWGETCVLDIYVEGKVNTLAVLPGRFSLTVKANVGQCFPAHSTASGRLFLANLSHNDLDDYLRKTLANCPEKKSFSDEDLYSQLEVIHQKEYSLDIEAFETGVHVVSAPILNHESNMIAAVSILGPSIRMTDPVLSEITSDLIKAAQEISKRMGWNG
jgi:DNA-binding IclR family transcriptional regulator